ncbi:hypothetical protein E0765_08695 [Sulfuricurvum sp. IAE1]|uniref:carbamoyltransferase family protein n=1 Tax=Sulfuricurvum sp. IAE1 TaxID=2546102 RepID=UPI00104BE81C|nr:carbamoyltransferase C-terminal domain-containing protein [Sulfuricurvum sp. IAE1]TDA62658.1 hypothetical protein E0765_08695 [Sulfuricurvum sp. IAE1]
MHILGISCGGESGVALFHDERLLCAANEERFSRIKLDTNFPENALKWCLEDARITPEDIDLIVYGFSNGCETDSQKAAFMQTLIDVDPKSEAGEIIRSRITTETEVDTEKYGEFMERVRMFFGREVPIERIHHHMSHVASAYVPSGMEKALVITADGRGDYRSLTIGIATPAGFQELYTSPSWNSLGYFYGRMTKLCGFTPNRHEGKVTGLAAYGNADKATAFVEKMVQVQEDRIVANLGAYYRPFFSNYSDTLLAEASGFTPEDLAAATQKHFERMVTELVHYYLHQTDIRNIAVAGGVFSNISLNQALYEIDEAIDLFVYPNMGDAGICAGGCYAWLWKNGKTRPGKLESVYLGYKIDPSGAVETLRRNGIVAESPDNLIDAAVEMLESGNTLGLIQGRAEFGPRALGNRSILASPMQRRIIAKINAQLGRDTFMPLAPMIPLELAGECVVFKNDRSVEKGFFMTMTYDAKPLLREKAEAVVHIDGTVRPQFVTKDSNPFVHALLMRWYAKTGCPALINTSFNAHEEPIVNTEYDALRAFRNNVVDGLLIPPYLCR